MLFHQLIQALCQYFSRLSMPHTNTHKHGTSYFKSTLHLCVHLSAGSAFPQLVKNDYFLRFFNTIIREYGSTLYVGLARAFLPTFTNFQQLLLPTQAGMPYKNTHKHRKLNLKSTLTFMGPAKHWKWFSAA